MNGKVYKEEIERIIKRAKEQCPNITDDMLDSDGAIYYMNGNDSTRFDWNWNDRLCEFMVFHKNEVGFIKIMVNRDNSVDVFIYEDAGLHPTKQFRDELKDIDATHFANLMNKIADSCGMWNVLIDELDWDIDAKECLSIEDTSDEEDWW